MKNKKKKTMYLWKCCLEQARVEMKKSKWQKFINTQINVMKAIVKNKGGRTKY